MDGGAKINKKSVYNKSPLLLALENRQELNIINLLLSYGAKIYPDEVSLLQFSKKYYPIEIINIISKL